jgi:hypothetical protein
LHLLNFWMGVGIQRTHWASISASRIDSKSRRAVCAGYPTSLALRAGCFAKTQSSGVR